MSTSARLQDLHDLPVGDVDVGPQTVHLDLTNACNTNCVTCWDHSPHLHTARPTSWKKQRVDVDATMAILDDIQSLDNERGRLQAVILSGMGEPFTHPDIYRLIADVKRRGLTCTIITNLVAADAARVVELGVDALLVGVQGASLESYLAFHPNFNASHWTLLQKQLAILADAPNLDQKHVQVICNTNAHELVAMVVQADRYAASRLNFKLASLRHGTEAVALSDERRRALMETWVPAAAAEAQRRGLPTNLTVFAGQLQAQAAGATDTDLDTAPIDKIGCFVGGFYARITVDGTVLFCCNTEVEVGNLRDLPFSSWWHSPRWGSWRRRMAKGHYLASCFQCGKVNQNEKLSARYRERFGDDAWRERTGYGAGNTPVIVEAPRRFPIRNTGRGALPVLP